MSTVAAAGAAGMVAGGKRRIIFPIIAGLMALLGFAFLDGVREAIAPWSLHIDYDPQPELTLWHYASHGASVGILFSCSMLALVWQPMRKPLLLQMYMLGFLTLVTVYTIIDAGDAIGFFPIVLATIGMLFAAFPDRKALLRIPRPGASRVLLGLTALAAACLTPVIIRSFMHAFESPAFEGAADPRRWGAGAIMAIALIIAGLLASSKNGGWLTLGTILGLVYLYLGAAAISIPDQAGSWGYVGGAISLAFGVVWLAAIWREHSQATARS